MKTAIILGTRPEIIKMAPIIKVMASAEMDFFVLHTGQHYSHELDGVFFDALGVASPRYNLGVGSGTHAEETGKMLVGIEKVLREERVTGVLVEGDTNTALAGALAAAKLDVKVGHVEAGLRSYDRRMPEEMNRVIIDHVSDYLFAPTNHSKDNLLREGITASSVFVTGNTIVDAIFQNMQLAEEVDTSSLIGPAPRGYIVATAHRAENVDNASRLRGILDGLELISVATGLPIVYPVHPRTKRAMENGRMTVDSDNVRLVPPVDYLKFLKLEMRAKLVVTDSGGVQEEACVLGVPCVTIRDSTERPETLMVGANILAGTNPDTISSKALVMLRERRSWANPFGPGDAGNVIVEIWNRALSNRPRMTS